MIDGPFAEDSPAGKALQNSTARSIGSRFRTSACTLFQDVVPKAIMKIATKLQVRYGWLLFKKIRLHTFLALIPRETMRCISLFRSICALPPSFIWLTGLQDNGTSRPWTTGPWCHTPQEQVSPQIRASKKLIAERRKRQHFRYAYVCIYMVPPPEPTFYKALFIKSFEGFPIRMNFSRFCSVSFGQDPR